MNGTYDCEQDCHYVFFFVICWAWLSPSYTLSLLCVSQNQANQKRRQANVTFLHKYITTIATIEINNWCVIAMQQQRNERRKKNVKKTSHHLSHKTIASAKFCDFCRLLCVSHRRWRSAFNDRRNKIHFINAQHCCYYFLFASWSNWWLP